VVSATICLGRNSCPFCKYTCSSAAIAKAQAIGKGLELTASQSLYAFVTLIVTLALKSQNESFGGATDARDEFSYFTVLTYWGLAFYFLFAAIHTFTFARTGTPLLDRFPRPLQALHSLFYTTVVTYPFLVTAVYWGVLYSGTWFALPFFGWTNVSRHMLNSVMAFFELLMTRTERPLWIHMLWVIVIEALYLALAYITRATKGFYVYSFLDPATKGSGMVVAYIFGIAVAVIVIFLLVVGFTVLRNWITEKKLGMTGKFAAKSRRDRDAEMAVAEKERPMS
jgi:hypothetical protein